MVLWAISGPLFDFSDTWQLIINTGTTIITFLMVFLIQNTQNRDAEAMHVKLDELIRSNKTAHNALLDLEDLEEDEEDKEEDEEETITGSVGGGLSAGLPDVDETTALLGTESPTVSRSRSRSRRRKNSVSRQGTATVTQAVLMVGLS